MHERKQMMAERADAFLALPGGIGTFEELFEVWTWRQLGYHDKPIGLLNVDGYYDALLAFMAHSRGATASCRARSTQLLQVGTDAGAPARSRSAALAPRPTAPRRLPPHLTSRAAPRAVRPRLRRSRRCGCAPPARPR